MGLRAIRGDELQIQYYVGDVGVDLEGDAIFDKPTAATLWLIKISDLK